MGTGPFAVPTLRRLCVAPSCPGAGDAPAAPPARQEPGRGQPDAPLAVEHGTRSTSPKASTRRWPEWWLLATSLRCLLFAIRPDSHARDLGDRAARWDQSARLAVAQVSRRRADPMGHLSRRDETGKTIIHMTPRVDAGPAIAQAARPSAARDCRRTGAAAGRVGAPLVVAASTSRSRHGAGRSSRTPAQASRRRG